MKGVIMELTLDLYSEVLDSLPKLGYKIEFEDNNNLFAYKTKGYLYTHCSKMEEDFFD